MALAARSATKAGYYDSVGGKVHTGSRMQIGWNLSGAQNYSREHVFINLLHRIYGWNVSGSPTGPIGGYYDTSPGGSSVKSGFWNASAGIIQNSQNIVVRWTGTSTLNVTEDNVEMTPVEDGLPGTNRRVYTPDFITARTYDVVQTGGTLSDLEIMFEEDEAAFDAGEIISPQWVTAAAGVKCVRFLDWTDANLGRTSTYTEYTTYNTFPATGDAPVWSDASYGKLIRMCQVCNKISADMWLTIPLWENDADYTAAATEIQANLDAGLTFYCEWGNELWNNAAPWNNGNELAQYWDAPTLTGSFVPATLTGTVTSHGLSTGTDVRCFNNYEHDDFPFAYGATRYIINDGANTLKLVDPPQTITAATNANPCEVTIANHGYSTGHVVRIYGVTGMTELEDNDYTITSTGTNTFTLDSTDSTAYGTFSGTASALCADISTAAASIVTTIKIKDPAAITRTVAENMALQAMNVWDLFEAQLGARTKKVYAWQSVSSSWVTTNLFAVAGFREAYDYIAIAPYYYFNEAPTELVGWETDTVANILTHVQTVSIPYRVANLETYANNSGSYRIIVYECGDHSSGSPHSAAAQTKYKEWMASSEVGTAFKDYYQAMADNGAGLACAYKGVSKGAANNDGDQSFNLLEDNHDTSNPKYAAILPMAIAGGASKT